MDGMRRGQRITPKQAIEPRPRKTSIVAPAKPLVPAASCFTTKRLKRRAVPRDPVVAEMTTEFLAQATMLIGKWYVPVPSAPLRNRSQ